MLLAVNYISEADIAVNQEIRMPFPAFVKHFALAGQAYPKPSDLFRILGMFFHYYPYLNIESYLHENKFSEPHLILQDPTEKSHFSNLAGKGIADFLSKRIDNSIFTTSYEAEMQLRGMPLNTRRPDLIAYSNRKKFAIEVKGFSGGPGSMLEHKGQSKSGGISVNFSVACVSYNLYDRVYVNYHDPVEEDIPFDNKSLSAGYFGVMVPLISVKPCHFERCCNDTIFSC